MQRRPGAPVLSGKGRPGRGIAAGANPPSTTGQSPDLLDRVARATRSQLDAVPEPVLRSLFDAFDLVVTYDPSDRLATCEVMLADDTLPGVTDALSVVTDTQSTELGICVARSEGFEPPTF